MTTAILKLESINLPRANWKVICIIGFVFFAIALSFYAYQISNLTMGYYLINSYEKKIAVLSQENRDLQLNFAESSFLAGVLEKAEALDFQKTSSAVKYLQITDSPVAVANKK